MAETNALNSPTGYGGRAALQGVAGGAVTAYTVVVKKTDGNIYAGDANDANLRDVVGIALNSASGSGSPVLYAPNGSSLTVSGLTEGAFYYLSSASHVGGAAGGLCDEGSLLSGEGVVQVGYYAGGKFHVNIVNTGVTKP